MTFDIDAKTRIAPTSAFWQSRGVFLSYVRILLERLFMQNVNANA